MKRFASCLPIFAFLIWYLSGSALEAAQLKKVRLALALSPMPIRLSGLPMI